MEFEASTILMTPRTASEEAFELAAGYEPDTHDKLDLEPRKARYFSSITWTEDIIRIRLLFEGVRGEIDSHKRMVSEPMGEGLSLRKLEEI